MTEQVLIQVWWCPLASMNHYATIHASMVFYSDAEAAQFCHAVMEADWSASLPEAQRSTIMLIGENTWASATNWDGLWRSLRSMGLTDDTPKAVYIESPEAVIFCVCAGNRKLLNVDLNHHARGATVSYEDIKSRLGDMGVFSE